MTPDEPRHAHHEAGESEPSPVVPSTSAAGSRRRFLLGALGGGAAVGTGFAIGRNADTWTVGDATPTQLEKRSDAFHGAYGLRPVIWSVPTATNCVAFTFDDGPDPEFTPRILDALAMVDAKATFMMMGWNCVHHPDLVARVVAEGHEVGNHTWSHLDLAKVDPATIEWELRRGRDAVERVSGKAVRYFRPPRGELSGAAVRYAAAEAQDILMWTINGGAHLETRSDEVRDHLVQAVKPGYIVDLHDGIGRGTFEPTAPFARDLVRKRSLEVAALPSALTELAQRGVRFLTITDLLAEPRLADP